MAKFQKRQERMKKEQSQRQKVENRRAAKRKEQRKLFEQRRKEELAKGPREFKRHDVKTSTPIDPAIMGMALAAGAKMKGAGR